MIHIYKKRKTPDPITPSLGKVEFWIEGKKSLGSGNLVRSSNYPVVATAAHCVYDWKKKSFYENISFSLYIDNFQEQHYPVAIVVPRYWTEQNAFEYDTAFLIFEASAMSKYDTYHIALPVAFDLPKNLEYSLYGFPNKFLPSKKVAFDSGKAQVDDYYHSSLQGIPSKRKSGMSGGPWVFYKNGEFIQNANTSLSINKRKNILWGTYWGDIIRRSYQVAIGALENDCEVIVYKTWKGGETNVV